MKNLFVLLIVVSAVPAIFCEVIQSLACTSDREQNVLSHVIQVRVDPCLHPGDGLTNPCLLERGTTAMISVDFVPKEEINRVRAVLAYVGMWSDFPFPGLESNGCKSIVGSDEGQSCPLIPDSVYTWSSNITLSRMFPPNTYPLKLKLTDGRFPSPTTILCQTFTIQLV